MTFEEELLTKLKLALEAEGFKASWSHPEWMRKTTLPIPQQKDNLFISDPPVPRMAPFDCAYFRIAMHEQTISFELYLCFIREVEKAIDAAGHNALVEKYSTKWLPQIDLYFCDFAARFGLKAHTDFDASIDYCLWGNIIIKQWGTIAEMMVALKALAAKNA